MKFNQFLLAPYIGNGSPEEQTMWIDDLTISTKQDISDVLEFNSLKSIFLSPNPASDYIEITSNMSFPRNRESEIKIYNTLGECVMNVGVHCNEPLQRIDISHLPVGVYFIKFGNFTEKYLFI